MQLSYALSCGCFRLFYECTLDTIRTGDVYNPGARSRVPRLYVIDGYADTAISGLPVGESFRLSGRSDGQRYEVLIKRLMTTIVRNQDGRLTLGLKPSTLVRREGDLTRTSDGITESKVALTAFDVCHYVNHRTMRLNERNHPQSPGYVTTFAGDEQATPHFMRYRYVRAAIKLFGHLSILWTTKMTHGWIFVYSGLTGACVNAMLFNNFIKQAIDGIPLVDRYASFSRQTHWSNAEVVHRGTGSNFGMDGFLRPGFSYDCLVDYLYARIKEHQESRQNLTQILTFVWKEKIAASLIPKGMELNKDFLLTLRLMLRFCIFNRIFGQVKPNWKIGRDSLNLILQEARKNSKVRLDDMMNWEGVLNEMKVDQDMKRAIRANHISMAKYLEIACNQIIDHASRGYLYNERIATELSNQPKPVGSILDDFAVEAQNFANSLVMAVAFSSVALAFRLVGSDIANTLSAVVSFVNIISSFGTMTNVARYKIRNEEARIIFFNEKLLNTKKAIFSLLDPQTRSSIPTQQNPFVSEIETRIQHFQESVRYYDYKESSTKTLRYAAKRLQDRFDDPKEIRKLQFLISSTLIPDTFHVNSYLQEELVELFRCLEEMLFLMKQRRDRKVTNANVKAVFDHLEDFTLTLEDSLQRGPIRFGFIKQRRFVHWDIFVVLRYLISLASHCFDVKKSSWTPIEKQTYDTLRKVKRLSSIQRDSITLKRETRDLEELYWATHESDIASMIFVSASFVFTASLVFTIARVFAIDRLERVAFWATAPSASGAFLAAFHFVRKLRILGQLWLTLGHKVRKTKISEDRNNIQKARSITFSQIVLTMLRLMAAVAATIALPWSIAENGYGEKIGTLERLPFYIALAAVIAAILATIFFFVVEYVIRYNLSPRLPKIIVESFRDEVNGLYWTFRRPWNDIETKQVQERVTWEYVAREFLHKYRFDTVFAADRFGSILQYLQSGTEEVESALDYYDKDPSEST